ncbi:malate dehydrogenase, mitochondrial-like [Periplaneta americana]|uniref:malate dehydrogenase, mitochondrial-like n=1 Tax=Periplaneta americana TaxID=6978 RepID=UPI0037E78E6B
MLARYVKFSASNVLSLRWTRRLSSCTSGFPENEKTLNREKSDKFNANVDDKRHVKVAVLGANGAVGQVLSLFLKQCPLITTLSLYDVAPLCGAALDVSHVDTSCRVYAYSGRDRLQDALKDADIVIMAAGVPQKADMPKGYLFGKNAEIIYDLTTGCCKVCPKALIAVLTNPINSTVPMVSEVLKRNNCYDANKVFGVAAVHVVRASTFVAERMCLDPTGIMVPVTGGNSAQTLVPVLSQTKPCFQLNSSFFKEDVFTFLVRRIRNAALDVMNAKGRVGRASLSVAYSTARFTHSLAKGLCGQQVLECAYVSSSDIPHCPYLINLVELGPNGILRNCGIPKMTSFEQALFNEALPTLVNDINLGIDFVNSPGDNA